MTAAARDMFPKGGAPSIDVDRVRELVAEVEDSRARLARAKATALRLEREHAVREREIASELEKLAQRQSQFVLDGRIVTLFVAGARGTVTVRDVPVIA